MHCTRVLQNLKEQNDKLAKRRIHYSFKSLHIGGETCHKERGGMGIKHKQRNYGKEAKFKIRRPPCYSPRPALSSGTFAKRDGIVER